MGKSKRSARTKGNTRPSSSGHSAELLGTTGLLSSSGIGFQNYPKEALGLKSMPFTFSEDVDKSTSDGASRIIMKKMMKRDAVTKLKAVQEFMDICSEDCQDVKSILPYWPRLFNKLALDSDKRVRESIHKANEVLILKVKRDIGPYLKNFMGTWLITQCDPYAPAASAAQSAFSSAFQQPKQSEALMFCRFEIIKMIRENLFCTSPDSFKEPDCLTEDECEEKYQLLVICTLSGMKLYVSILSQEDKKKILEDVILIMSEQKFWAYSQSKVSQIRGTWYSLVSILCHDMPEVFQETKSKLISSATSSLSESDPVVAPAIWECALQVIAQFQDWWHHVNHLGIVLSELWEFLKYGGMGNAVSVFPCLLPFLSKLPAEITFSVDFYKKFFTYMRESFFLCRLKISSECGAIVKAFLECFQYSIEMVFSNPECDSSIVEYLISEQLIPLIKNSLTPEGYHVAASAFYSLLGQYLNYLEIEAVSERKRNEIGCYSNFLTLFWENLYAEIVHIFNIEHKQHVSQLTTLTLFFQSLHQPAGHIAEKKGRKVQFHLESENSEEPDAIFSDAVPCQSSFASLKYSFLFDYSVKICGYLCHSLQDNMQPCCIKLCSEIISTFGSSKLFFKLLSVLHIPVKELLIAPQTFFQEVILKWVKHSHFNGTSLESIADIIFCICSCLNGPSAMRILDICSKVECQKLYCILVIKSLDCRKSCQLFSEWCQTPIFRIVLKVMTVRLIKKLTMAKINVSSSQTALYHKTLLRCIASAASEGPRIPRECIDTLLNTCLSFLPNFTCCASETLEMHAFLDLICDICENILHHSVENQKFTSLDSLIFHLFVASVQHHKYNISEKQQKRLWGVWQAFIESMGHQETKLNQDNFFSLASDYLHSLLQIPLSKEMHIQVLTIILDFLAKTEVAYCNNFETGESMFTLITEKVFPSFDEWECLKQGLNLSVVPSVLKGRWWYPILSQSWLPVHPKKLPQLIITAETISDFLHKVISLGGISRYKEVLLKFLLKCFPHLLWTLSYIESLEYFKIQVAEESAVIFNLKNNCTKLASLLPLLDQLELVSNMFHLSINDGMKWALPFAYLIETVLTHYPEIQEFLQQLVQETVTDGDMNKLITVQVCLQNAPVEYRIELLNSIPKNFFNVETYCSSRESDYFGVLSLVNCCVQEIDIENFPCTQEALLGILNGLVSSYRFFISDESECLLYINNVTTIVAKIFDVPNLLSCELWYSVMELIVAWFERCLEIGNQGFKNSSALILMHRICSLICMISCLFEKKEDHEVQDYYLLPANSRWQQMFNDCVSQRLVRLYLQISESVKNLSHSSDAIESLMIVLSQAVDYLNIEQIVTALLPLHSETSMDEDPNEMADDIYKVLCQLTPFLTSSSLALQFGIHSMLSRFVVHIPKLLSPTSKADDYAVDENAFRSFPLVQVLWDINDIVETVLDEVKIGDHCILKPYTDSYTYTMAYLLTWTELLEYFSASPSEERSVYASYIEESKLLSSLLISLIRMKPENPSSCSEHVSSESMLKHYKSQSIFLAPPPIFSLDTPSYQHLQHVACSLYYTTMKKVPALVRTWWNGLDKKTADIVEKFTSRNISGLLSMMEIRVVHSGNIQFSNMTVKARPSSREVLATYALDDSTIELSIQLPTNYPLGPIVADSRRKMGVGQAQWRNWLLQLTTFLNYHNGSIMDALALWKRNLDKKFEGVEECMICYFVLHSTSCKLPSVSCSTCKKKFHSSCLYKWFSTSNNSTCPSCRNFF